MGWFCSFSNPGPVSMFTKCELDITPLVLKLLGGCADINEGGGGLGWTIGWNKNYEHFTNYFSSAT